MNSQVLIECLRTYSTIQPPFWRTFQLIPFKFRRIAIVRCNGEQLLERDSAPLFICKDVESLVAAVLLYNQEGELVRGIM